MKCKQSEQTHRIYISTRLLKIFTTARFIILSVIIPCHKARWLLRRLFDLSPAVSLRLLNLSYVVSYYSEENQIIRLQSSKFLRETHRERRIHKLKQFWIIHSLSLYSTRTLCGTCVLCVHITFDCVLILDQKGDDRICDVLFPFFSMTEKLVRRKNFRFFYAHVSFLSPFFFYFTFTHSRASEQSVERSHHWQTRVRDAWNPFSQVNDQKYVVFTIGERETHRSFSRLKGFSWEIQKFSNVKIHKVTAWTSPYSHHLPCASQSCCIESEKVQHCLLLLARFICSKV